MYSYQLQNWAASKIRQDNWPKHKYIYLKEGLDWFWNDGRVWYETNELFWLNNWELFKKPKPTESFLQKTKILYIEC